MIQEALGIESDDIANYCFPKTWPADREQRARIIGEWLQRSAISGLTGRRFPPPRSAEEHPACYIVKDANGFALAYLYYEEEPGRRSGANLMPQDEARHIAANIELPELALR